MLQLSQVFSNTGVWFRSLVIFEVTPLRGHFRFISFEAYGKKGLN